jgi:hypothetical protein
MALSALDWTASRFPAGTDSPDDGFPSNIDVQAGAPIIAIRTITVRISIWQNL